jgi:protein-disulfide isomerase
MKVSMILSLLPLAVCLSGAAQAADANTPAARPAVLEINGAKVTTEDVDHKLPGRLLQARATLYQTERKALDEFIEIYLLEQQAKAESLTVEALMEQHVNASIAKEPSEEVLRLLYDISNTTETYEKARAQILERLRQARLAKARVAYVESLRAKANVSYLLAPPRVNITLSGTPVRGAANAPIMLVEYADYECPYCQMVQPAIEKVLAAYDGKVAFAFKDVPLPMHANAPKAAEATHCAEAQGKFWEYHDLLFSSKQLDPVKLKEHARTLKLDATAFDTCLDSGSNSERIKTQLEEAQDLGLNSTPSFFINGRFVQGNLTYDQLRQLIDEEVSLLPGQRASAKR